LFGGLFSATVAGTWIENLSGEIQMKVYVTGNSPYARKVRVAAIETGQRDEFEWQLITREERAEIVPSMNPLGKVPVAVLESGEALYDSPVICAYVDAQHDGPKLIPEASPRKTSGRAKNAPKVWSTGRRVK
jgi:glutathione S-transferase